MVLGPQFSPVDKPFTGGVGMKKGGAPGEGSYRNLGPADLSKSDPKPERSVRPRGNTKPSAQRSHREIIEGALAQHPKKISFNMFAEGLSHMGVRTDKGTLKHLATTAQADPDQFSELVGRARGHFFNAKDQQKAAQRRGTAAAPKKKPAQGSRNRPRTGVWRAPGHGA